MAGASEFADRLGAAARRPASWLQLARFGIVGCSGYVINLGVFTLTPIVEGGQSAFFAHGVQICEGAVVVRDADGNDIGRGFAEAVAFADTLRNQLRLAGLPDDDAMVALAAEPVPSPELAAANAAYVAEHQDDLAEVVAQAKGLQFFMDPDPTA